MGISSARHPFWPSWAQFLQRNRLNRVAASLIEAAGPFAFVGAQAIYLTQPLIGPGEPGNQWQALAELLENRDELRNFATFLREETQP